MADRHTSLVIIAPHGGRIEIGTSEIAKEIAGFNYSFYCFQGLKLGRPHTDLHITSTNFDEPRGLELVKSAEIVIAIHGRSDDADLISIWIGGLHTKLKEETLVRLTAAGFNALANGHRLEGKHPNNICNRGKTRAGLQLELPRSLRMRLAENSELLNLFTQAVRGAIATAE